MACSALQPPQRRGRRHMARAAALALAAVAAATVAAAAGGPKFPGALAFTSGRGLLVSSPTKVEHAAVVRRAEAVEVEAPPSDAELATDGGEDPRPFRRFRPKREIRGTLCYARRELNEESERLRPYIEPLLERQLSIKEITFVLNRIGSKLRPLLYKPRQGLPIFTPHKVRRLLRRARTPNGRLIKYVRPGWLPPLAPGAPYRPTLKDVYAEVPPLKPWTPSASTEPTNIEEEAGNAEEAE